MKTRHETLLKPLYLLKYSGYLGGNPILKGEPNQQRTMPLQLN